MNTEENIEKENWSRPRLSILDIRQTLSGDPIEEAEEFGGEINVISDY